MTYVYQGDQRVAGYDTAIGNIGLHVGSPFGRYGEIRLGVLTGFSKPQLDTGPPELAPPDERIFEGAFGGLSLEAGRVGDPLVPGSIDSWLRSAAVFVGVDTPLGPTYLGYGYGSDGSSQVYFYVGRVF